MQSIISSIAPVIGLGSTTESGQEPRSGVKGAGTAADPYDAGNAESQFEDDGKSGSAAGKSLGHVTAGPEPLTTENSSLTEPGSSTDQTGRNPVTATAPSSSLQSIINTIAPVIGFGSSTSAGQEPRSNDGLYEAGNASGNKGSSPDETLEGATAGIANLTTRDSASTETKAVKNDLIGESSNPSSSFSTKDPGPSKNIDGLLSEYSTSGNPSATSYRDGSTDSEPKIASFSDSKSSEFPNLTNDSSRYEKPSSINTSRPDSEIVDLTTRKVPETSTSHTAVSTNTPSFSDSTKPQAATSSSGSEPEAIPDPSSGQQPAQKQQGADRPLEEPIGEQADALAKDKSHAERAQAGGSTASHSPPIPGLPSDDKSGPPADVEKDNSSGTGEKYVKSTGLAAHGGNFDAAAPGAGKEADRLLEAAGVKHGGSPKGLPPSPNQTDEQVPHDSTEKVSLKDKIKGKLHIGKH